MATYLQKINQYIEVRSEDPDDARRRKLLNIILAFSGSIALLAIVVTIILGYISGIMPVSDATFILISSVASLLGSYIIYIINRNRSGTLASTLFLILLMVVVSLADTPVELSIGRSSYLFLIPIIISGVLLGPMATFIFYFLSSLEIIALAVVSGLPPTEPTITILSFLLLTTLFWLASNTLESSLAEARDININLDNIVRERTHELAEALRRASLEAGRSRAILESIADGVIVFDRQKTAIRANPAISILLNVPLEDIIFTNFDDLVDSSPMDTRNKEVFQRVISDHDTQLFSYRVEWGERTLSISSAQVLDHDQSNIGTVAVFRDFTKEAELERMKSTFVAMVSHELRTPLSVILGYAEIFLEQIYGVLNQKQFKMINRIVINSNRLLTLINDLLDQAQIEAGKLKINYEVIRPSDLLINLHNMIESLASDKGLAFTSTLDENMPETIISDSARLEQILVNLVQNAIKFTNEGSIQVQISRFDEKNWTIAVKDTGKGIPQKDISTIFEAFRQVEDSAIGKYRGSGLGLSIVNQLVTLMGGTISVESEVGIGSTFSVTLPVVSKRHTKEFS